MTRFNPLKEVSPDDLETPEVREWSLKKYNLVGSYCEIFSTGMKNKWDQLAYIDLFAGAGYTRIKETHKTYYNSAFIAMSVPDPFTKYILCEKDEVRFKALEKRVKRDFSHLNVELIHGDSNEKIEKIIRTIPSFRRGNTLLSFCFVDPFSLDLNFNTIRRIGKIQVDFLILQALHMDFNRNFETYLKKENQRVARYLGMENWRDIYHQEKDKYGNNIVKFLSDQYQKQMTSLGYQEEALTHQIRSNDKNLPLYYLSFYSKNPRGREFFKKVKYKVDNQLSLDF